MGLLWNFLSFQFLHGMVLVLLLLAKRGCVALLVVFSCGCCLVFVCFWSKPVSSIHGQFLTSSFLVFLFFNFKSMCCCFSSAPVEGDERADRPNKFQISLINACFKGQPCCCMSCFCPCCAACKARKTVLDDDMTKYLCCQGYICPQGCCCIKPGGCGESSCPDLCLCFESFCCLGPSMSSSRLYSMDKHMLANDECDNRMIRFSNCLQILACVCNILAIIFDPLRELAKLINCIADMVFYSMMACMSAQITVEEEYQANNKNQQQSQQVAVPYANPEYMPK